MTLATRSRCFLCLMLHWGSSAVAAFVFLLVATAAQAQHDCVDYDPTDAGEAVDSTWTVPTEIDNYQINVPNDMGGGYVVARITATAPAQPRMSIVPPSGVGVVAQNNTNSNGPSPHELEVVFEVYGGETYEVELREDVQAPLAQHPLVYQWTWSFVSRVDCYEHNDGSPGDWPDPIATARAIPLEQQHEAYSIAGHLSFTIPNDADHSWDWYKFNLGVPTTLWLATTQVPSDQRLQVRLFNANGQVEVSGTAPGFGETTVVGPALVDPGTYYVEIHPVDNGEQEATLSEGGTIPDHFNTPYHFVVGTAEVPPCGFMPIFCNGYESGDTTLWSNTLP